MFIITRSFKGIIPTDTFQTPPYRAIPSPNVVIEVLHTFINRFGKVKHMVLKELVLLHLIAGYYVKPVTWTKAHDSKNAFDYFKFD